LRRREEEEVEAVMGTDITSLLEKLADLMTAKAVSSPVGGEIVVPQADPVFKLELMPNEARLNGVSSYLSWSRRALLILKTKGLMRYVLRTTEESADKESLEWKKWSVSNSLV
jgi:hypothetical protein